MHHPPSQVLHALLVRELAFRFAEQAPYLHLKGILLLHLVWALEARGGGIVLQIWEERFTQELRTSIAAVGR